MIITTELNTADDLALFSHTHNALQEITNNLLEHEDKVKLHIRPEKAKATRFGKVQKIRLAENFTHLGRKISNYGDVEKDEETRFGKAAGLSQQFQNI